MLRIILRSLEVLDDEFHVSGQTPFSAVMEYTDYIRFFSFIFSIPLYGKMSELRLGQLTPVQYVYIILSVSYLP